MSGRLSELIAAREKCAALVLQRGDVYLPIFERLEREIETLEARESALARVRRIAAKNGTQNGTHSGHHGASASP